jgi:L-lactate dehydrogenase (cytochrome)
MKRLITVADVERAARRRIPRLVDDFIQGGAEDERAVTANRAAFGRWSIVPRVMVDVATRDLSTTVLGTPLAMPIGVAPVGLARLARHEGETASAAAAGAAGTVFSLSTGSSRSIEEVAAATRGPRWFQLYLWRDRDVIGTLIDRAQAAGYTALLLTADVPVMGQRDRDLRNGMTLPPRLTRRNAPDLLRHPGWLRGLGRGGALTFANFTDVPGRGRGVVELARFVNVEMMNPGADWSAFEWVRQRWSGPLAVKGVLHPDDARRAVDLGADGIVVSNHGGRQLDAAIAALDALPAIVEAVGDRCDVLLDGGVRRGTDVLIALALGARAVLVGRPAVLGLAAGGQAGVARVLEILRAELDRAMALAGLPSLAAITPDAVRRTG